jgi:glycosyltransferase involved in cell wall biosynthesis
MHSEGSYLFVPLARLLGMKVVVTVNTEGYKQDKWGFLTSWLVRLSEAAGIVFSNKIISVSEPIASNLRKQYKRSVIVIPNGVEIPTPSTTDEILSKFGIKKYKYILTVSRFIPGKGIEDVIDAFNNGNFEDWKLVLVGHTEHKSKYCQNIEKKVRGNKNIILTGFIKSKHLQELYTYARLFVFPSYYEACPIVVLEAMSYGLSCIVSDIPANKYFGLDEDRFFKPGDIKSLTEKMKEFINKSLTEEEKIKQISFISQRYNWRRIADETLRVYREVMEG